jgi:hypothetical protein
MSRILKRPMFRTGGTPNEGIMHGLVNRRGYSNAGTVQRAKDLSTGYSDILRELVPAPKARFPMGQVGLNLVSGEYAGDGFLQNVARSAKGPYSEWTKADDARRDYDRQLKMAGAKYGIQQAMTESTKDTKITNTLREAQEAVAKGMKDPRTGEDFASLSDAFEFFSLSTGDYDRSSYNEKMMQQKKLLLSEGRSGTEADMLADFNVRTKELLIQQGTPRNKIKGALPRKKGKPNFSKMEVGEVFIDLKDGKVKIYKGQDEATGEYLLEPIEI